MYSLRVKNFQSIKDVSLRFSGFTTITGGSNSGKSALVRALGVVLYNDWDKSFSRVGGGVTSVRFVRDGVYDVLVEKGSGKNKYTLDRGGERFEFSRVGRGVPDEIVSLGFGELDLDGDIFNLSLSHQLDSLFMVGFSDGVKTKLFNHLFNVSRLESAVKLVVSDVRSGKLLLNRLVSESDNLKSEIVVLRDRLLVREEFLSKVKRIRDGYVLLSGYFDLLDRLLGKSDRLREVEGVVRYYDALISKGELLLLLCSYIDLVEDLGGKRVRLGYLSRRYRLRCLGDSVGVLGSYLGKVVELRDKRVRLGYLVSRSLYLGKFVLLWRYFDLLRRLGLRSVELCGLVNRLGCYDRLDILSRYLLVCDDLRVKSDRLGDLGGGVCVTCGREL